MRPLRIIKPGKSYYVLNYFLIDLIEGVPPKVRQMIIDTFQEAKEHFKCEITNILVLESHIELVITPKGSANISDIMKWAKSRITKKYNRMNAGRSGTIWNDRFFSSIIETLKAVFEVAKRIASHVINLGLGRKIVDYPFYREWDMPKRE